VLLWEVITLKCSTVWVTMVRVTGFSIHISCLEEEPMKNTMVSQSVRLGLLIICNQWRNQEGARGATPPQTAVLSPKQIHLKIFLTSFATKISPECYSWGTNQKNFCLTREMQHQRAVYKLGKRLQQTAVLFCFVPPFS